MKKIILIFLITGFLQGCIPSVFIAGAAAGGAVIYDHRSAKVMIDDRNITFQAQNDINNDQELHEKSHISVATFNHIVLLLGQAPNSELRSRAESIVKSNSKVKMIYNEITIENSISNIACANDAWITTKVKTVLLTTPDLNSTNLKIVTEKGVVYLMGLTTRTQAQIATNKTRTVAGVQKVVKLFEYLN
jgi:osmotically-inducible protein OsmY